MEAENEKAIIKNCQAGQLEEFRLLYDTYIRKIYDFIYFKTHHRQAAEDLTSQTFFKALANIKKFDAAKGRFSSWLYCLARNTVIDYYRTKKAEVNIADVWDLPSKDDLWRQAAGREQLAKVRQHLQKLNSEQRDVVLLRVWQDLSYGEIAQIMGKSEANCKMIFSRALGGLRSNQVLAALLVVYLLNLN